MGDHWYLYKNEQQKGPFKWDELLSLARAGIINPNDKVMSSTTKTWVTADQFDNLLNSSAPKEQGPGIDISPPPPRETEPPFSPPPAFSALQSTNSNLQATSKDSNSPPPQAFNRAYQPPKVSVPSEQGPVFHTAGTKSKSSLARFKLPLIIAGALIGIFVFIAVITSLYDDSGPGGNISPGTSDIAPTDTGSSPGTKGMRIFNEPGYGFTMNYPQEWSYGIDESGYVYFEGDRNTEESQITVIVDFFPSLSAGGDYQSIEEFYIEVVENYYLLHGESYGYETSVETIGGSQHKVVFGGGTFEHQDELYSEIAVIIERDSSTYYLISFYAPEDIFYDYQEMLVDVFLPSFIFTS